MRQGYSVTSAMSVLWNDGTSIPKYLLLLSSAFSRFREIKKKERRAFPEVENSEHLPALDPESVLLGVLLSGSQCSWLIKAAALRCFLSWA